MECLTEAHGCVKMTGNTFLFKGIPIQADFINEESLLFAQNFLVKDDDVIIVTYPRSGKKSVCMCVCKTLGGLGVNLCLSYCSFDVNRHHG